MKHDVERASTTDGLPISPSLGPALELSDIPSQASLVDARVVLICGICIVLAMAAAVVAQVLARLIALIPNVSFFGHVSWAIVPPSTAKFGWFTVLIPAIGGVIVGLMARYGS